MVKYRILEALLRRLPLEQILLA